MVHTITAVYETYDATYSIEMLETLANTPDLIAIVDDLTGDYLIIK